MIMNMIIIKLSVMMIPKVLKVAALKMGLEAKTIRKKRVRAIKPAPLAGDSVFIDSLLSGC